MDSSKFKLVRSNAWHASASISRTVEEAERCSCFSTGSNCSTEECINRGLLVECSPQTCECKDKCENQRLQRGKMPKVKCALQLQVTIISSHRCSFEQCHGICRIVDMSEAKGKGMVALELIPQGTLVAEYFGVCSVLEHGASTGLHEYSIP
jgi:hypothetical protein